MVLFSQNSFQHRGMLEIHVTFLLVLLSMNFFYNLAVIFSILRLISVWGDVRINAFILTISLFYLLDLCVFTTHMWAFCVYLLLEQFVLLGN